MSHKKDSITLEDFEKEFFKQGFVLDKEEIEDIYKFLLEMAFKYDNKEREHLDYKTFSSLLLQINQELNKEIKKTQF